MKKLLLLLAICCSITSLSFAQPKQEPPKLVQFHMALLKKGPQWDGVMEPAKNPTLKQHIAYFVSLLDSGRAVIGGPTPDSKDLAGIYILRAPSAGEAKTWVDADPAVKNGLFTAEMHPWWSEDIFRKATTTPLKMETVYLGFLKRGPN